jgi:hypothetical protein
MADLLGTAGPLTDLLNARIGEPDDAGIVSAGPAADLSSSLSYIHAKKQTIALLAI